MIIAAAAVHGWAGLGWANYWALRPVIQEAETRMCLSEADDKNQGLHFTKRCLAD